MCDGFNQVRKGGKVPGGVEQRRYQLSGERSTLCLRTWTRLVSLQRRRNVQVRSHRSIAGSLQCEV